ncbi:MAG: cupin domain-containing protein [Deltaproteobacteria bacterium]|nr:cupin domain-containing protein [Deltaproteobacteria bacterium]
MDKVEQLNRRLEEMNLVGYWGIPRTEVFEPVCSFAPNIWRWKDVSDALREAGEILPPGQSFRRFIAFKSPGKARTTHTVALGLQLVKPGEIAEAHRHTMGAIRFVLEGGGAQTTVEGEPFPMERGDLITTPNWTWHDHFNGSDRPVIWLDGTDRPLLDLLEIGFGELFSERQQMITKPVDSAIYELAPVRAGRLSSARVQSPPYRYRWKDTERALKILGEKAGDPFDGLLLRYVNPLTGGFTLPTFSCEIQMLRPKEETRLHRHTSSAIYHVFEGRGFTVIEEQRFEWEKGDTLTVPLWRWHRHGNNSGEPAILFAMNDRPVMESLGFYREEATEWR